jgi:peptidyl-prolyl cis-trans isomerase D
MEAFRRLIKGWLGKVLLVLFLVPFALVGIEGYFSGSGQDATAVKVNGEKISQTAIDNMVNTQRQQLLEQVQGDATQLNDAAIQKSVKDNLISKALLLQQAKKLGFDLSDQQVAQLIQQEPTFQENGKYSEQLFQTYLRNSGTSLAQLLSQVREQVALQQLAGGINSTGLVSAKDIDGLAKIQTEKRQVWVASLPLSGFAQDIKVTNQQIADYYNKNKASLKTVENADVDYVVLDSAVFAAQVKLTEADIQAQYQAFSAKSTGAEERHIQHILIEVNDKTTEVAAKKQIDDIAAKVKAGEDFGALAKQYSQDAGSAANNGDLGFLAKGTFAGAFDDAAFALATNQVSAPVRSESGYHLIKVLDIKKSSVESLEAVRPQMEQQARQAKIDELYSNAVNSLNDMAVDSDNLQDLAKAQHLTVFSAKGFARNSQLPPLNTPEAKAAIFSDEVVHGERKISTGVELDATHTAWIKVSNYRPVREQNLAEATPAIQQILEKQAIVAKAEAKATQIITALKTKTPAQVQQENAVSFQSIGDISRMSGSPKELEKVAFSLATPKADHWTAAKLSQGDNMLIIAVASVTAGDTSEVTPEIRTQLSNMLSNVRGQQDLADYAHFLKSRAKIKNQDVKAKAADKTTE